MRSFMSESGGSSRWVSAREWGLAMLWRWRRSRLRAWISWRGRIPRSWRENWANMDGTSAWRRPRTGFKRPLVKSNRERGWIALARWEQWIEPGVQDRAEAL